MSNETFIYYVDPDCLVRGVTVNMIRQDGLTVGEYLRAQYPHSRNGLIEWIERHLMVKHDAVYDGYEKGDHDVRPERSPTGADQVLYVDGTGVLIDVTRAKKRPHLN